MLSFWLALSASIGLAYGQVSNSFPHNYPGKPSGDFSPAWQSCTYNSLFRCLVFISRSCGKRRLPSHRETPQHLLPPQPQLGGQHPCRPYRPSQRYTVLLGLGMAERLADSSCGRESGSAMGHLAKRRVRFALLSRSVGWRLTLCALALGHRACWVCSLR